MSEDQGFVDQSTVKQALEASIQKWTDKVNGVGRNEVCPLQCPLCVLFYIDYKCIGCPVMDKTGKDCCKDTPYWTYYERKSLLIESLLIENLLEEDEIREILKASDELGRLAQAEVDFLVSLRS